ncbi:hypothetical protein HNO88_001303 [Novosphingobium chloroacetimidivorans]|uniref:PAS domain-containing protein n=1 Tax=Novosphingobium chloroacetimidivorans TaxID=1428314 RepID=A0A7W7NW28_9SPHN|nr:hypothetical protein [Novosphingobium chloroacetimidivorans]MBB4857989.1 hypothetical protein [Novosphingobium chloroacetimidivorans]
MDSLRGQLADLGDSLADRLADRLGSDHAIEDEHTGREPLPFAVGQAERRLQVRAYNFWAALLGERQFPASEALDLQTLPDFAGHCVLLDVGEDREDPKLRHVGHAMVAECGLSGAPGCLSQAPSHSLLSRIANHYRPVFASNAPVGFEAEFVNWRGATILYRGILLPFSRDDAEIDQVLCVINWKEVLDARVATALQREIAESYEPLRRLRLDPEGGADWAGKSVGERTDFFRSTPHAKDEAELPPYAPGWHEALRALPERPLASLPAHGEEFTLLIARRAPDGQIIVLGEVPHDIRLLERAARSFGDA